MNELTVISGKGGTGKTSITASFAILAQNHVIVDCDVDAPNLHLVLRPSLLSKEKFSGGYTARIKAGHCIACDACQEVCAFDAIYYNGPGNGMVEKTYAVEPIACEGCGVCLRHNAIELLPSANGEWYISSTHTGPMIHAKLGVAEENSGKLVATIRNQAKMYAQKHNRDLILIDGPPGIGCPVISSITGVTMVLIVTEPSRSALHDLERIVSLSQHFHCRIGVCINKHDINPSITNQIETRCQELDIPVLGKIEYSPQFTESQIQERSVVEYSKNSVSDQIKILWKNVLQELTRKDV